MPVRGGGEVTPQRARMHAPYDFHLLIGEGYTKRTYTHALLNLASKKGGRKKGQMLTTTKDYGYHRTKCGVVFAEALHGVASTRERVFNCFLRL